MNRRLGVMAVALALLGGSAASLLGLCGPFSDVTAGFCPLVLELYYLAITAGTSPTTFSPDQSVTRGQASVFVGKGIDTAIQRSSRRAILGQYWTSAGPVFGMTGVGSTPELVASDGADLWVASLFSSTVSRIQAGDGKLRETWTAANNATGVLSAMGQILVTGFTSPGKLYQIDPTQPAGTVTTVASNLGNTPRGIAFDGSSVWTANYANGSGSGSVSIITPQATTPWPVTTVTTGFAAPVGILYDGANIWVTDNNAGKLFKLDNAGAILQTVTVGGVPQFPLYDGSNIWVPNFGTNSITVVQAATGTTLQTLTGNGLSGPVSVAFDGERILVTNYNSGTVSLWKATNLTPLGSVSIAPGSLPNGACSTGLNFWITLAGSGKLVRF